MLITCTKMKGGLALTGAKFLNALRDTKTRAETSLHYTVTEMWNQGDSLNLPIFTVREKKDHHIDLLMVRKEDGSSADLGGFFIKEFAFEEDTTIYLVNLTQGPLNIGTQVMVRLLQ